MRNKFYAIAVVIMMMMGMVTGAMAEENLGEVAENMLSEALTEGATQDNILKGDEDILEEAQGTAEGTGDEEEQDEEVLLAVDTQPDETEKENEGHDNSAETVETSVEASQKPDNTSSTENTGEDTKKDSPKKNDKKDAAEEEQEVFEEVQHTIYAITYRFFTMDAQEEFIEYVQDDGVIAKPTFEPDLEGYTFLFWYNPEQEFEDDIIVGYEFDAAPTEDLVLWAMFEADAGVEVAPYDTLAAALKERDEEGGDTDTGSAVALDKMDASSEEFPSFIVIIEDPQEDENDGEIVNLDDAETPLAGPAVDAEREIVVESDHGDCVMEGDIITMSATLIGYDDCDVMLQWQYNDGNEWVNAENGNGLTYSFEATTESINYGWRLGVTIMEEIEG